MGKPELADYLFQKMVLHKFAQSHNDKSNTPPYEFEHLIQQSTTEFHHSKLVIYTAIKLGPIQF